MRRGLLAQTPMNKKSMIALAASIILTGAPLLVQAAQITPNPNPAGSTLDIINDPFAVNNATPYSNGGTINIDASSTLTNTLGATLKNTIGATLNNYGALGSGSGSRLTNVGTLNNYAGARLATGFGTLL